MAVPIWQTKKCDYILNLDVSLLILFFTVLDIFDDKFMNSTVRNKENSGTQMTD